LNRRSKGGTKLPKEITVIGGVAGLVGLAALLHVAHAGPTLTFICCALALAGVAHVIVSLARIQKGLVRPAQIWFHFRCKSI